MKSILLALSLLTSLAQASSYETTFTCYNANKTIVATDKKISVVREVSLKRFDIVTHQFVNTWGTIDRASTSSVIPAKGAVLNYMSKNSSGVEEYDVITILDLTDRRVTFEDRDKGGYGISTIEESYKIKAEVALSGLASQVIDMECLETLTIDNR